MALDMTTLKHSTQERTRLLAADLLGHWQQMVRADAPVLALAAAFAIGTLVSMVPVPVIDMMVAALVMRRLQRLPRGPMMAAMALWNSFIMAPLYATSPRVGGAVLAGAASRGHLPVPDTLLPRLVVGNAAIALALVVVSFLLAATFFAVLRRQRLSGMSPA